MTPHVGQLFEARVLDMADGMEVERTRVDAIPSPDFSVIIRGLEIGHSYNVDFYADFNESGYYDVPPTDHAWRLLLENVQGDTTLTFAHNTDFTDIEWRHLLTLELRGFTPHLGQLFEARLVDITSGGYVEVAIQRVESFPEADFDLSFTDLEGGHTYNVDFYADFNGNKMYDPPPTDHAWRLLLEDVQGDTTLTFNHNTDFTDIEWGVEIDPEALLPDKYALHQNYPNPFNPITTIQYDLPEASDVRLVIYDLLGREVITLIQDRHEAGYQSVIWNGRNRLGQEVATGIYIYQLIAGDPSSGSGRAFVSTKKLVLIK